MIPFGVVVLDVLRHGPPEMPIPNRNQPRIDLASAKIMSVA